MDKLKTVNYDKFSQQFPNEEAARLFFETMRWGNMPVCGHCGSYDVSECKGHKPMPYRCKGCRKHFSVRIGTALEESRLPLHKWLRAMYIMTNIKDSIPLSLMAEELDITKKTAQYLSKRIYTTWRNKTNG